MHNANKNPSESSMKNQSSYDLMVPYSFHYQTQEILYQVMLDISNIVSHDSSSHSK